MVRWQVILRGQVYDAENFAFFLQQVYDVEMLYFLYVNSRRIFPWGQ